MRLETCVKTTSVVCLILWASSGVCAPRAGKHDKESRLALALSAFAASLLTLSPAGICRLPAGSAILFKDGALNSQELPFVAVLLLCFIVLFPCCTLLIDERSFLGEQAWV
jgi:hypothetical protein